jgi:hypothetical protein
MVHRKGMGAGLEERRRLPVEVLENVQVPTFEEARLISVATPLKSSPISSSKRSLGMFVAHLTT